MLCIVLSKISTEDLPASDQLCCGLDNCLIVGNKGENNVQSKSFIWVCRNISALVGCIKKLRALYEVQFLETFQIPH